MINISKNHFALQLFLQIINAYGAFTILRSNVKLINKQNPENDIVQELWNLEIDHYSESDYGLSKEAINELSNNISSVPKYYQNFLTQKKIIKKLNINLMNNFLNYIPKWNLN